MKDKRILFVSSEVVPYLPETELSSTAFNVAKNAHSKGVQTRIFMPRYGVINERRHQLHEVIRLSGMNLVVNDMDMPLIIKVASIPKERMQVYFIDNEEYFKRKAVFTDEDDNLFEDNDERAIFFAKGVIETVKKLNWAPDIIHCHGWLASFMPMYLKKFHYDDPLFADSKIVFSAYGVREQEMPSTLIENLKFDGFDAEDLAKYENPTVESVNRAAMTYSDGTIIASENADPETKEFAENNVDNYLDLTIAEDPTQAIYGLYEQVSVEETIA